MASCNDEPSLGRVVLGRFKKKLDLPAAGLVAGFPQPSGLQHEPRFLAATNTRVRALSLGIRRMPDGLSSTMPPNAIQPNSGWRIK